MFDWRLYAGAGDVFGDSEMGVSGDKNMNSLIVYSELSHQFFLIDHCQVMFLGVFRSCNQEN